MSIQKRPLVTLWAIKLASLNVWFTNHSEKKFKINFVSSIIRWSTNERRKSLSVAVESHLKQLILKLHVCTLIVMLLMLLAWLLLVELGLVCQHCLCKDYRTVNCAIPPKFSLLSPQERCLFFWFLPTVARHAFFYLMDYIKIHFHKSKIRMQGVMIYFYGLPYLHNDKIQDDHCTF